MQLTVIQFKTKQKIHFQILVPNSKNRSTPVSRREDQSLEEKD